MTEQEWLACTDPKRMLDFLRGKASERKFRLFSVACCRRIWHLFTDERSKEAVEIVERFADREISQAAMQEAVNTAWTARVASPSWAARAAREAASDSWQTARAAGRAIKVHEGEPKWAAERHAQAALLRDLFGRLPFRRVSLALAWRTWQGGLLVSMARRMYDSRDFTDMSVLADALEEAGCSDLEILSHCRQPAEHVRGCWVVDLLLGKE